MARHRVLQNTDTINSFFEGGEDFSDPIITSDTVLFVTKDYLVQQRIPSLWRQFFPFNDTGVEIDFAFRDGPKWVILLVVSKRSGKSSVEIKGPYDLETGQLIGMGLETVSDLLLATYLGYFPPEWSEKRVSLRQQLEILLERSLNGAPLVYCGKRMVCLGKLLNSLV